MLSFRLGKKIKLQIFSNLNTVMTIILFDVDGTLTPSGGVIKIDMIETLEKLSNRNDIDLGVVGGGSYDKIKWQLGDIISKFKYIFAECGSVTYVNGKLIAEKNMLDHCNRNVLNLIIKKALNEISNMPIIYNGHQIEFRKGLIYISPPGMQASNYERDIFMKMDKELGLRKSLMAKLSELNNNSQFEITLGGAVGIGICPIGWNKSQVINYFKTNLISDDIYYFGDKTEPDGNDYPIYSHPLVHGVSVIDYTDTINYLIKLFIE